jgi:hypothetical protein
LTRSSTDGPLTVLEIKRAKYARFAYSIPYLSGTPAIARGAERPAPGQERLLHHNSKKTQIKVDQFGVDIRTKLDGVKRLLYVSIPLRHLFLGVAL